MAVLELFLDTRCFSASRAIELAQCVVANTEGLRLFIRDRQAEGDRARFAGVFITPAFVLDGELCALGTPSLDSLVMKIKKRCAVRKAEHLKNPSIDQ